MTASTEPLANSRQQIIDADGYSLSDHKDGTPESSPQVNVPQLPVLVHAVSLRMLLPLKQGYWYTGTLKQKLENQPQNRMQGK